MKLTDIKIFRIFSCGAMPKIMHIAAGILKKVRSRMLWPHLILPVKKNKLLNLSPGDATYFTNLFNIHLTNVFRTRVLKYTKNQANWFRTYEDAVSKT